MGGVGYRVGGLREGNKRMERRWGEKGRKRGRRYQTSDKKEIK
jgi:hypothetical protein